MSKSMQDMNAISEVKEAQSVASETNQEIIEEEEENSFQDVDLLQHHGISLEHIETLKQNGLNTIKGIQMVRTEKLQNLSSNFDKPKIVQKIQAACSAISANNLFTTALEVSEQRKSIFYVTTGSDNLDKLLGGGVQSMSVTETFGEAGTGKTQLAHSLCVTAQMPAQNGYTGGKVIFIDTEHTFRPNRIRDIARRYQLEEKTVLENILYARAYNSEHQFELLKSVSAKFHEEPGVFKLLIVDSIMALFRVDFSGRKELASRQEKIGVMMSQLQKISEEYNIAVFITNQITADVNKFKLVDFTEVPKPSGGNVLAHSSTTRVALKKIQGNVRIAVMYDSPELEECEGVFVITSGGISDPNI